MKRTTIKTKKMKKPFEICFDFPLAHSKQTIPITATATLHNSEPYYIIDHFRFSGNDQKNHVSLLPALQVKKIRRNNMDIWVDCESERESLVTTEIGKAIDAVN